MKTRPDSRQPSLPRKILLGVLLMLLAIAILFPIYYMISISLKHPREIYREPSLFPESATLDNYVELLTTRNFLLNVRNSTIVAMCTTAVSFLISLPAAYSLERLRYRVRGLLGNLVLLAYFVPSSLLFIPLARIIAQLHLGNTLSGLIFTYLSFATPLSTWLLMGYFRSIPIDLDEQALIDGATHSQVLVHILLPLAAPGLVTVNVFTFTSIWNELLYALVFISSPEKQTIPVALQNLVTGDVFRWGLIMAGSVVAAIPVMILYYWAQRFVVHGLVAGSIK